MAWPRAGLMNYLRTVFLVYHPLHLHRGVFCKAISDLKEPIWLRKGRVFKPLISLFLTLGDHRSSLLIH